MQLAINNNIITTFKVAVEWDLYQRKVTFIDQSSYGGSSGSGIFQIFGISFLLEDQQGVVLTSIDFSDATKYIVPTVTQEFEVDLSQLSYPFIFQTYKLSAAIKDNSGNIYEIVPIYKKICQPLNLTESGYVPGIFQVAANCPDNELTVKELTLLTYNNSDPLLTTKTGILYYPTGTISSVSFTGTPFRNNVIYTGQYRITCTTVSEYDMDDDVTVLVTYLTNNTFDITCANKIADLICCMVELQTTYLKNCNNAKGQAAKQQLDDVTIPFLLGLTKEINGQDASNEADLIRKTLKCDCGATSIRQNEFTPVNPSVTNIVLTGVGGTTVPAATVVGSTKTYSITSSIYQVVKGVTGDLGFTIDIDTSTTNVVKYKITLNYNAIASSILTAIGGDNTLIARLNALITSTGNVSLAGLDGKCIIDVSTVNLVLSQPLLDGTAVSSLSTVLSGVTTTYNAPANTLASNPSGIQSWLNGLGIGTFTVVYSSNILTILSLANSSGANSMTFTNPDLTVYFQKTNKTLVNVLQAIIDYLCELTALQMDLGAAITLWQIDYSGNMVSQGFGPGDSQATLNAGIANSIYNIVNRIYTLTGITCAKIAAAFPDSASSVVSGASRFYGYDGDGCVAWTYKQVALGVIAAIQADTDVKDAFCAIECTDPATCPDVAGIRLALVGSNIGVYGLAWTQTPNATQTVTVRYKRSDQTTYTTATSNLLINPSGNIQGTTPFEISGLTQGQTYDVQIVNNCGGVGFVNQITIPTGAAYSGSYLRANILYLICAESPVTLYTGSPFAVGVYVFTNSGLTIPLTGYSYIVENNSGEIYTIDPATGQVLADTGNSCANGVSNSVLLSNSTDGVCGAEQVTRYTNGPFAIGGTLYTDSSLTTPVTGYSYVLNSANGHIYNLNSATGVIGTDTGLTCASYNGPFGVSVDPDNVCSATSVLLYSSTPFAVGVTMYTDAGLTTLLTGYSYIAMKGTGTRPIYNINATTGVVGAATGINCES